jgi:hypothetical protein
LEFVSNINKQILILDKQNIPKQFYCENVSKDFVSSSMGDFYNVKTIQNLDKKLKYTCSHTSIFKYNIELVRQRSHRGENGVKAEILDGQ